MLQGTKGHPPASETTSPFISRQRDAFITCACQEEPGTSAVHRHALLAPAASRTLGLLASCSASGSLFTRPGLFAFPAPINGLFILIRACPWMRLVSLAIRSSKEHTAAGRKSITG